MFNPSLIGWLAAALVVGTSAAAAPAKKPAQRPAKAAAPAAPPVALTPGQLEAAGRVLTGPLACEFDQQVRVMPVDGKPGHFSLTLKKTTYTLVPQETTTGAVRLEDRGAGIVWIQIPAKSMLLDARSGQRLVDRCQHEEQRLAAGQPQSALGILAELPVVAGGQPAVIAALPGVAMQEGPPTPGELLPRPLPRTGKAISPDGQWLAWIAPREGVPNVWVALAATPNDSRPVTDDRQRGVHSLAFARDGRHLLYARDEDGGDNLQVYAFDLAGGEARALSPKGSRATIAGLSDFRGGEVLLSVNDRDPSQFDLMRVVVASGDRTRVLQNDGFAHIVADASFAPRYASRTRTDGGSDWFVRHGDAWQPWSPGPDVGAPLASPAASAASAATVGAARPGVIAIAGLSADGRTLYLTDSRGRDTPALYAIDTTNGTRRLLLDVGRADVDGLMVHPSTGLAQASKSGGLRGRWVAIDPAIGTDLQRLEALAGGADFSVNARTRADDTWVVTVHPPDSATKTYLYDRASGSTRPW